MLVYFTSWSPVSSNLCELSRSWPVVCTNVGLTPDVTGQSSPACDMYCNNRYHYQHSTLFTIFLYSYVLQCLKKIYLNFLKFVFAWWYYVACGFGFCYCIKMPPPPLPPLKSTCSQVVTQSWLSCYVTIDLFVKQSIIPLYSHVLVNPWTLQQSKTHWGTSICLCVQSNFILSYSFYMF